jgi:hypothetical protein
VKRDHTIFHAWFNTPGVTIAATVHLQYIHLPLVKELQIFSLQVSQSKFTAMKILTSKNFGKFMGFFPKGLSPCKIQTKLNFVLVLEFLIQILLGI